MITDTPMNISSEDYQLIYHSRIFKGVNIEDLGHLIANCELIDIDCNETLIQANSLNDSFYVVLAGELKVQLDASLDEHFINLFPGDCAGELSILENTFTSAQVIAATDSHLLKMSEETLWRLVRASHNFARNLLLVLAKRLRNNNIAIINGLHQQQDLEHIANIDGLTGLFNRRWMNEYFKRQITRALSDNKPMALLITDIDHFKHINDTHGYLIGDEVLFAIATILTQQIRPSDLLARYGGEEFALILPDTSTEEAKQIAERIRATLDASRIKIGNEFPVEIHVTISIGISPLLLGDNIEALLHRADQALYKAKGNGRNRIETA